MEVTIKKRVRGFTAHIPANEQGWGLYAFDRIEDLASWLVEQWGEPKTDDLSETFRRVSQSGQTIPNRKEPSDD
jgi:hypothetical protein